MNDDRLFRSRSDRMLAGVAGGLADRFELDPSLVRVGWAILTLLSGGVFLVIYIVMAIVVPEEPFVRVDGPAPAPGSSDPAAAGWSTDPGASDRWADREARRAARRAERGLNPDRPSAGGIIAGLILIGLGGYFLVRMFAPQIDLDRFWPAGLVLLGILLIALSVRRTPGAGAP